MTINHRKFLKERTLARQTLLVPGVMNALAARIADDIGYEAMYITGAGVSNAYLGLPDVAFLTLTQLSEHVSIIRNITDKPLIVDGDTGFGNAVNVWHTVRTLERAGASAIQLEDQVFPKRCGHFYGKSVIETEEMVQKIKAAVDSRIDGDFQIIARTDAYAVEGLGAAIDRAHRYLEAGADILFVEAPTSSGEILSIIRDVPAPHLVNMVIGGKTEPLSAQALTQAGAAIVLYANASLQGAIVGMQRALTHLRTQGILTEADGIVAPFTERQRLVGMDKITRLEKMYSTK